MSVPLLSEIQTRYKRDLVIIGVTAPDFRGNTPKAIRQFVKQQGEHMNYTVAIDKKMGTTDAYLGAARVDGIPWAFIVDKTGRIVWQGSPLQPELDSVVGQVVAGTYDVATAKAEAKASKLLERLIPSFQMGQWSVVWDGLLEVLEVDPGHDLALDTLLRLTIDELHDMEAYRSWCRRHIAKYRTNVRAMQRLATLLCLQQDLAYRAPDLALEAAKAAYQSANGGSMPAIEVFARAHYQVGDLDRAIALQQEAVAAANGSHRGRAQAVLDFYGKCKDVRASLQ